MKVAWELLSSVSKLNYPSSSFVLQAPGFGHTVINVLCRSHSYLLGPRKSAILTAGGCGKHIRNFRGTGLSASTSIMNEQSIKSLENVTMSANCANGLQNGAAGAAENNHQRKASPKRDSISEYTTPRPAILRYQPGAEYYQLSCFIQNKAFNLSRSATEPVSIMYDRLIKNASKKLKHFEEKVCLRLKDEVLGPNETLVTILEKMNFNSTVDSELNLQVDNETLKIQVNPPEVTKIKFFKNAMVGFPILPAKLEGSQNFNPKLSKYVWEHAKLNPKQQEELKTGKKLSASRKNSWSECSATEASETVNSLVFIPDESLLGTRLRFTCTPTNDGSTFGQPMSEETNFVLTSPPTKNFVFNERLKRLDSKPATITNPGFLRVITYNTLADTYATKEWFTASPEESLSIDYRLPIINHEIKSYQGDLVCLQEIDDKYYERFYQPFLSSCGLNGYFSCKTNATKEGVAMFYNRDKLNAVESLTVSIGDHMKTLDFYTNTLEKYPNIIEGLNERNTVLQILLLESLTVPGTMLLVANTHLYFHPDADHIRLLQTLASLNFIETKLQKLKTLHPEKTIHFLFCGDFNCTPPFSSFRTITSGRIEESDFDWTSHETEKILPGIAFSHNLNLINSHPDHELTNIVKNFEGCLDYIFYQPSMKLLKTYPPPSKATIGEICGTEESNVSLPNFHAPSDHVPLITDFSL